MFKKILIANRGEIACRVIKTARKMGIKTVAVYSDADSDALHVQMADEAVHIGPPPANQSYIVIDKVMEAIRADRRRGGASGLWFPVAKTPNSPRRWRRQVSPSSARPWARSRRWATRSPRRRSRRGRGLDRARLYGPDRGCRRGGEDLERDRLSGDDQGQRGGGGKGMRIAWNDDEAREGFQSSKNEAAAVFGDDRIFIEKFVTQPRHIEIQVLCDSTATAFIWASANARSSAGTRR